MGPYEPFPQQCRGLVGGWPVKRHQCGGHAGCLHDVGAPAVGIDRSDLNQVRTACNRFFKATNGCVHNTGAERFVVLGNADDFTLRVPTIKRSAVRKRGLRPLDARITPEKKSKKISLSGDSQEMHVASTGFPQLDARGPGTYA
jgi:hypothetical protein